MAMGSNAVPFLIKILGTKSPVPGKAADETVDKSESEHGEEIDEDRRDALRDAYRIGLDRDLAAYLIGQLGPTAASAIPTLLRILEDPNEDWRLEAEVRDALSSMSESGVVAVPHYMDYLRGDDDSRTTGAELLASVGPKAKAAVPLLSEAVASTNAQVRWAAARALWSIDRQTNVALHIFLKGLASTNETRRVFALDDLRQMGPAAKDAGNAIASALLDEDNEVRRQAEKALRAIDPALLHTTLQRLNANSAAAVEVLIQRLQSEDPRERFRALELIGIFGPDAQPAVPALIEILNGSGPLFPAPFASIGMANSQREAALALAEIGPEARAAVPALISLIHGHHIQYEAQYIKALGRIGPDARDAIPLLQEDFTNENRGIQLAAADALTRIAPRDCSNAVAVLRELQHLPKLSKILLADSNGLAMPTNVTNFDDPSAPFFYAAASVPLWKLGLEKEPPVHAIMDAMTKQPGMYEHDYVDLLGDIGPEAKPALPLLVKRLNPPWSDIAGRVAAMAIRKIDPEEAATLQLPGSLAVP